MNSVQKTLIGKVKRISPRASSTSLIAVALISTVLAVLSMNGCKQSNQTSGAASSVARQRTPETQFDADMRYVRSGNFRRIYVLRRRDGKPFDSADNAYLKANTHPETNQHVAPPDKSYVIAGTNFNWTPENMAALNERFTIEDRTAE